MIHLKKFNENSKQLKESSVVILNLKGTDKILFLMRREGWCLPGGKLDGDETPTNGAIRECEEETSITPKNIKYLGQKTSANGRVVHVFSANTKNKLCVISNEHSSWKWVDKNKMMDLDLAGNTGEFLSLL